MVNAQKSRNWLLALVVCVVASVACILYLDRPLASFFDAHVRHTTFWSVLNRPIPLLDLVVVAALLFLIACGIRALSGHSLPAWTRTPLLCSWSAMWAVSADIIFKHIFGRWGPDSTYVEYRHYGFYPLHADALRAAFPSGTAAISAAIASVLWLLYPRSRVLGLLVVVLLCAMVVIMNYHWLSDTIAGAFLGTFIGCSTLRLGYGEGLPAHE